jgi:acylpyruvate hydrolase
MNTFDTPLSLVTYERNGRWEPGIRQGDSIISFADLDLAPPSVRELLAAGPGALDDALGRGADALVAGSERAVAAGGVRLGPPVPDPEKILCVGLNYADHAAEAAMAAPDTPTIFAKFANSLIGPTDSIVLPGVSEMIDFEGELVAVIGTNCKDVAEEDALNHVAGYTVFNDVSARDLQMAVTQWTMGKAIDTFGPLGPGIVPRSAVPDPQALELTTRLNSVVVQHANTDNMIFSIAHTIAFVSRTMTLRPGDLIATGTPAGVGFARTPQLFMGEGDVVEVEIEGLGCLRNDIVAAADRTLLAS